jgi:enoyl-CoA hydratase
MTEPELLVERRAAVALVTLHRPAARNALTSALIRTLSGEMQALDADDSVPAIVLTGSGSAFCAGLDLAELASTGGNLDLEGPSRPWPALSTPVVAAVNGPAITGGLELVLHADLVIASTKARFADTHCRVGVMPGWGMSVLLPEAIGRRRAKEMSLTGNLISAEQALSWGLVNHVVEDDQLLPAALRLAGDIASADKAAIRELMRLHNDHQRLAAGQLLDHEADVARSWARRMVSPEAVGARRAGIERRGRAQLT